MSRNNHVKSVLVTSGNAAVLAAGSGVGSLAVGQIGVFDANTGVSIDGTGLNREVFLAVGLDRDGDASMDDIKQSAGQHIQRKGVVAFNYREHSAARPQIGVVTGYKGDCDTDYAIKFEFRDQEIYRTQGFNQYTKTFAIRTDCCDDCATCPSGDANEVTEKFLVEIGLDESGLITAQAVARQAIVTATVNAATTTYDMTTVDPAAGAPLVAADLLALKEWNSLQADETTKLFSDIEYTTVAKAINSYCTVNLKYYHPRQVVVIPSLVDGFSCNGSLTITQEVAFEEGNGYDIAQKEFHASGNSQNRPYVLSDATGVPPSLDSFADKTAKYDQFHLEYVNESEGGWQEFKNNMSTLVAIPAADTTTRNAFATVMDALLAGLGFDALADDAAAATTTTTVVSPTSAIDNVALDGLS